MGKKQIAAVVSLSLAVIGAARANVTLFLEEPYGTFGGMNPTGHAAIYLPRVCAASPVSLRLCKPAEEGVVISRYHRVADYDWVAIPLTPYLYAVERPDEEVPLTASAEEAAAFRDAYRRAHLESVAPDAENGATPQGDWIQRVGSAYDRTIYAFTVETTEAQDLEFIRRLNEPRPTIDTLICSFTAVRISFASQSTSTFHTRFTGALLPMRESRPPSRRRKASYGTASVIDNWNFPAFVIPQVQGTIPRSTAVRGCSSL